MTHDTRIAPFLMGELVAALRANDPDPSSDGCMAASKTLESQKEELLLDWLDPFTTVEEQDRLLVGIWGKPLTRWGMKSVEQIPQTGELIYCWKGNGVFTRREPHTSHQGDSDVSHQYSKRLLN